MNRFLAMDIAKKKATEAYTNKYHTGAKLEVIEERFQCSRGVFNIVIKADDMAIYDFSFSINTGDVEFAEYYREAFTRWREDGYRGCSDES